MADRIAHGILDLRIEQVHRNDAVGSSEAVTNLTAQGSPNVFGQNDRVLLLRAPLRERLEQQAVIANRHALVNQAPENLRNLGQGQQVTHLCREIRVLDRHFGQRSARFLNANALRSIPRLKRTRTAQQNIDRLKWQEISAVDRIRRAFIDPVQRPKFWRRRGGQLAFKVREGHHLFACFHPYTHGINHKMPDSDIVKFDAHIA